ncbi:MAG: hypothetical protein JXB88_10280 [Spirochaetales bacterium]|nr:hypothetical protein [Spirochaetales bacterium]
MIDLLMLSIFACSGALFVLVVLRILLKKTVILYFIMMIISVGIYTVLLGFVVGHFGMIHLTWGAASGIAMVIGMGVISFRIFQKPINQLVSVLSQASRGNLDIEYPLNKISYYTITEFNIKDFPELEGSKSYCFYEIGSFALEMNQEIRCPALRTGKYRNCTYCHVYSKIHTNEFTIIGSWFNYLMKSLKEIEISANKIASGNLTKQVIEQNLRGDLGKAFTTMGMNLYEIIDNVKSGIVNLVSIANEIKASAEEQKTASTEQASGITEVSATLKELSITARQITKSAGELVQASEEVTNSLEQGQDSLLKTVSQLEEVGEISKSNTEQIGELVKRSVLINDMVEIIKQVANKTNMLAINASIEASKAEEAGKGFNVVAAEIRELSKETISSAKKVELAARDIQDFLGSIVIASESESGKVIECGTIVKDLHTNLRNVINRINSNFTFTQKIDVSIKQQENGSNQAAETMKQMAQVAKQSAEVSRETANTIGSIVDLSRDLETGIQKFRIDEK